MQATDANFYGTTYYGGAYSGGTVFKINTQPPYTLTTLYSFCSQTNCTDGTYPAGGAGARRPTGTSTGQRLAVALVGTAAVAAAPSSRLSGPQSNPGAIRSGDTLPTLRHATAVRRERPGSRRHLPDLQSSAVSAEQGLCRFVVRRCLLTEPCSCPPRISRLSHPLADERKSTGGRNAKLAGWPHQGERCHCPRRLRRGGKRVRYQHNRRRDRHRRLLRAGE